MTIQEAIEQCATIFVIPCWDYKNYHLSFLEGEACTSKSILDVYVTHGEYRVLQIFNNPKTK